MQRFKTISIVLKTHALAVGIFFIFRLILFITEIDRVNISDDFFTILQAFIMGIRFDNVISGYILLLPVLTLTILELLNIKNKIILKIIFFWVFVLFLISFVVCAADIPYFNQFFSRFSIGAFEWLDNPKIVFGMIVQEPKYFLIIIPLAILITLFYKILKRIFNKKTEIIKTKLPIKITISILFIALMLIVIRGRIEQKSPIRIGTAYFSNHAFLNQLGLNPVFTLIRTTLNTLNDDNKYVHLIEDKIAIKNVQVNLKIDSLKYNSPIARKISPDSISTTKPNIVFIIMESMSAEKMKRHGDTHNKTPFLDSISHKSYYFENIYSAGKHTYNGIFSTLFSFPALFRQHTMKEIKHYNGISSILKKHGYSTTFFINHDTQFDNIEGFLRANDFDNVIGQKDYPSKEVKTTLGVPDDFMFRFSIPIIDKLHNENKPFFVSFMTASDHGPYYIPDYFKPKNTKIKHQIVEYADWSIRRFFKLASKKIWFNNTIFVLLADHGNAMNTPYSIPLSYHHEPFIIYAPKILQKDTTYSYIGGQIDVFPTIMGLLNLEYVNNTLGIDLLKEHRPYILFNEDDKIGVIDNEFLLIFRPNEISKLYKYRNSDTKDYAKEFKDRVKKMEIYAKSNMQVYQYMLLKNKTFVHY